jgi:hypothetical protein
MLTFLAIVFGLIIFVALLIGSPAFRWGAAIVAAILVLGVWAMIENSNRASREYQAQREQEQRAQQRAEDARWQKIKLGELEFRNAALSAPKYNDGPRQFSATVRNSSESPVTMLSMVIRLFDCNQQPAPDFSNCETIGESRRNFDAEVPPNQTRQVSADFDFRNTPPLRGRLHWSYHIAGIRGS